MNNPQIFSSQGKMVYQCEISGVIHQAIQQSGGTFFKYIFYPGQSKGTPSRNQDKIKKFVAQVEANLK